MTASEVAALGPGLASLMNREQLTAAYLLFNNIAVATTQNLVLPLTAVRNVFMNHLQRCIRMPAGGAAAGGSQQTGFEMELVTAAAASQMFASWPNHESSNYGNTQSWELRNMEDLAERLALEETGWGAMQGKPMTIAPGTMHHVGVILVGMPFTVSFITRPDCTTSLSVRFPLILWSEEDAVVLPPDTVGEGAISLPFYIDPPNQPGYFRDLFKTWGRRVAAQLVVMNYPMSHAVKKHLPKEYASDSEVSDAPITERSVSPELPEEDWRDNLSEVDSSDLEGAHRPPTPDSSDAEGAHRP